MLECQTDRLLPATLDSKIHQKRMGLCGNSVYCNDRWIAQVFEDFRFLAFELMDGILVFQTI